MSTYRIQVPVIVNSNTAQVLVVTEIPLDPPAYRIDEIHKMIEIDDSIAGWVVVKMKSGRPKVGRPLRFMAGKYLPPSKV